MNKIFGFLVIALALSNQAIAGIGSTAKTTCTALYGEGYSWLVVEILDTEYCLRCDPSHPQHRMSAKVSVPYGPRGNYITQSYNHLNTQHYRLSQSSFKKVGVPSGPNSDGWGNWFPERITIYSGTIRPLYIDFKGESLELKCK